ncbi:unnamed protein product, partial [Ectocarpus sp. 8 AP-2014]
DRLAVPCLEENSGWRAQDVLTARGQRRRRPACHRGEGASQRDHGKERAMASRRLVLLLGLLVGLPAPGRGVSISSAAAATPTSSDPSCVTIEVGIDDVLT